MKTQQQESVNLISRAIAASEDPENELDFSVQKVKDSLTAYLEFSAKRLNGEIRLKKLATHPSPGLADQTSVLS